MTNEEIRNHMRDIEAAVVGGHMTRLTGIVAEMLVRITAAQEALVAFTQADLEEQIEEAIKSRAEVRAEEIVADKSKRSFIGKK